MGAKRDWLLAIAACVLAASFIAHRWHREVTVYEPNPGQLPTQEAVSTALRGYVEANPGCILIPTGVFIQSVAFVSSNDANITGYIWQRYGDDVPADVSRGLLFPEQVVSGATVLDEQYRRRQGSEEVIGWYFDVTVRQVFDYGKYPLDTHDVWLRLWHRDFDRNVVLVPDLESYDSTGMKDTFGVDRDIVPGGWSIMETFFSYRLQGYDTDFGIRDYVGQHDFPELYFNITLRRAIVNAFVIALVPLLSVLVILFSVLIMSTSDGAKARAVGFTASGAIGGSTALLFVVMLAHIDLRRNLTAGGLVYLEHFYLIAYAAVLSVCINVYLFAAGHSGWLLDRLHGSDNRIAKLAYWPLILLVLAIVTAVHFP